MTFALTDEASIGVRSEMLGTSSLASSEEPPFLLAIIKRRSVDFLEMLLFFMGQLQSALSEHLIIRSGRLQARSIFLSGCNILVKYLC